MHVLFEINIIIIIFIIIMMQIAKHKKYLQRKKKFVKNISISGLFSNYGKNKSTTNRNVFKRREKNE